MEFCSVLRGGGIVKYESPPIFLCLFIGHLGGEKVAFKVEQYFEFFEVY